MGLPKVLLALDTSGPETSVALFVDGEPRAFRRSMRRFAHSNLLPTFVLDLLQAEEIPPESVGGMVLSGGPGYFTALRTGFVFAKAFHLVHGVPVALVPTLEALVMDLSLPVGSEVTVLLDAQKGEVYRAVLRKTAGLPEVLIGLDRVPAKEVQIRTPFAVGSGVVRYFRDHPARVVPTPLQSTALGTGLWALEALRSGVVRLEDPSLLTLRYGRLPDAVVHRLMRKNA